MKATLSPKEKFLRGLTPCCRYLVVNSGQHLQDWSSWFWMHLLSNSWCHSPWKDYPFKGQLESQERHWVLEQFQTVTKWIRKGRNQEIHRSIKIVISRSKSWSRPNIRTTWSSSNGSKGILMWTAATRERDTMLLRKEIKLCQTLALPKRSWYLRCTIHLDRWYWSRNLLHRPRRNRRCLSA